MADHYCHECALRLGLLTPVVAPTSNITGSTYQLGKFMKHTMPTNYAGVLSIFDRPEYTPYLDYTVTTAASGSVEVDAQNRVNLIWYAGKHVGMTFEDGIYYCPDDAIKVVLHHDITLVHSFSANYEFQYINRCKNCDRYIPP
ncbi:MAG: hypothetical protein LV481_01330 [Methylacidiphilales bacterium]|nr:hypothetical protein [Candidatus Methylacidiphilales bacterium]